MYLNSGSPGTSKHIREPSRGKKFLNFATPSKGYPNKNSYSIYDSRRYLHDKDCCGHMSKALFHSFLVDLQKEVRHLDPTINLLFEEKTVFSKVLSAVHQTIEYIRLIQSRYSNTDWVDLEDFKTGLGIKEAKLKNETEKLKITSKQLEQYDLLLQAKDQQLKEDEASIKEKLHIIQQEEFYYEELKLKCIKLEQENRSLKKQYLVGTSTEEKLAENYEKSQSDMEILKAENEKFRKLLLELPENGVFDQKLISLEKVKIEQEKMELAQARYNLEQEKNALKALKADLEKNKIKDPDYFESSICGSEINFGNPSDRNIDLRSKDLDVRDSLLSQCEKEFTDSVALIKESIENYNAELESREKELDDIKSQFLEKEKILNEKLVEAKLIENSLQASKEEMNSINSDILPAFENYSHAISSLLTELYSKKKELEEKIEQVEYLTENLETQEAWHKEECFALQDRTRKIEEFFIEKNEEIKDREKLLEEKEVYLNKNVQESIVELSKELENRLEEVKAKEKEIATEKELILEEKQEIEKNALMLKLTHLELENEKNKQTEKLKMKKEKLRLIKERLLAQGKAETN